MSGQRKGGAGQGGGARLSSKDAIDQLAQLGTGHSRDEIKQILRDAGGDIIEASNKLFEVAPFQEVMSKKDKAEQRRLEREAEDRKAAQLARQEAQRRARENREAQNRRRPQPRRAEGEEAAGEVKVAEVVVANGDAAAAPAAADAAAAPAPRKAAPPSMADIIRGRAAKAPAPAEPSKESDQGTSVEQDITSLLGSADHHAYRHEEIEAEAAAVPQQTSSGSADAPSKAAAAAVSTSGVLSLPPSLQPSSTGGLDVQFGGLSLVRDTAAASTAPAVDTSAFSTFGLNHAAAAATAAAEAAPAASSVGVGVGPSDAPAPPKPRQPAAASAQTQTVQASAQQQQQPQQQPGLGGYQAGQYANYYGMQGSTPSYFGGYNNFGMGSSAAPEPAQAQVQPAPPQPAQAAPSQSAQPSFQPSYGGLNPYSRNYGQGTAAPSTSQAATGSQAPGSGKFGGNAGSNPNVTASEAPGSLAGASGVPQMGHGVPFQQTPMAYGMYGNMYPNMGFPGMYYGQQYGPGGPQGYGTPYPAQASSGFPNQGYPSGPGQKGGQGTPSFYNSGYAYGGGYGAEEAAPVSGFSGKDGAYPQQGSGYGNYTNNYGGYGYSMPPAMPNQQSSFNSMYGSGK